MAEIADKYFLIRSSGSKNYQTGSGSEGEIPKLYTQAGAKCALRYLMTYKPRSQEDQWEMVPVTLQFEATIDG